MKFRLILLLSFISTCLWAVNRASEGPIQYVNTYVGTSPSTTDNAGKHGKQTEEYGQTLPAVLVPNGMNFMTPQTRDTEKKCIAPYYYKDSLFQGFRNSHWIVGGCTQDYGSMTLMPMLDRMDFQPEKRASHFSHSNEISTPAYYSTLLDDYQIQAEMTATTRCAIFRFTFRIAGMAYIAVNPNSDEGEGTIHVDAANGVITGNNPVHRIYQGWGKPAGFSGHFVVKVDRSISKYGVFQDEKTEPNRTDISNLPQLGGYVGFPVKAGDTVIVKMASSFTDLEHAKMNLQSEIPYSNFDAVRMSLENRWNSTLSDVTVSTKDVTAKRKFYTALYHSLFLPRVMNDVDGAYPAFSKGNIVYTQKRRNYYDDYSMWDTYRALHPLMTIIRPNESADMMESLVDKYRQGGWFPIFPCWNSYTAAMIGDHCASVIADAYVKGIRNFDVEKAYEGLRKNVFESPENFEDYKNGMGRRALKSYLKYGYVPLEDSVKEAFHTNEQVSRTLEYAYDDYALSQLAAKLGKTDDAVLLKKRAQNYRHVIDPTTGYARGRYANGQFINPFNPYTFAYYITEGYPAHYSWYAPQDIPGLKKLMGGEAVFRLKLDSMFTENRYWHGNEPCHQVAFLFNYTNEVWRTQKYVNSILNTEYKDVPGGLSGNDDAGQMSAWYVFAALGFFPVTPATPYYLISGPTFERASIALTSGKSFTLIAKNHSPKNMYIQSVTLNGKPYKRNYISHFDIVKGGEMVFVMGSKPSDWGIGQTPPTE
jgi:predicted alpha-1,2-mannosidase